MKQIVVFTIIILLAAASAEMWKSGLRDAIIVPNNIVTFLISVTLVSVVQAELFTATSEVEPLLETQMRIIDDLEEYVQKEEQRLFIIKKHLVLYKREHEQAMEDIQNYLGNPINAFTLIKRLTTDLDFIEESIKIGTDYLKNVTMNHSDVKYPTLEDLAGAAHALTRLKNTYHLDVRDLAEGMLNGVSYSNPMSAGDCYELSLTLYIDKDYKNGVAWMLEALRKYTEEGNTFYQFDKADMLEYISFSHYMMGDIKNALIWTKKLLELEPNHPQAQGNVPHYQEMLRDREAKQKKKLSGDTGEDNFDDEEKPVLSVYEKERRSYEVLCRGELDIPEEIVKQLTCRYQTENHPFLKLAPIKVEQRYIDPDVYVFHDVISDDEIEHIMEMAKPRFNRSRVHNANTGELVPVQYRISKSGKLKDEESEIVAKISRRISDFTGLSMDTAEDLHVVNYGIGGHYVPHFDFARKHEKDAFDKLEGNRIATVLFYLSDVAQGGATVFTELGLGVFPIKGAALFWMNLHPSGEGDLATRHAACPVLRGSKWISNKWIHQVGQELLKPCTLEYQQESMVRYIAKPVPKSFR